MEAPLFNNVNTDDMLPGKFLRVPEDELGKHAFANVLPNFQQRLNGAEILVGGTNMGCGSSREQAPKALLACGVKVIVAQSFGYIFYRNAINLGLAAIVVEDFDQMESLQSGEAAEVNLELGQIVIGERTIECQKLGHVAMSLLKDGGLMQHLKKNPTPFKRELNELG